MAVNSTSHKFVLIGKGVVAVLRKDGSIETVEALHIVSMGDPSAPAAMG